MRLCGMPQNLAPKTLVGDLTASIAAGSQLVEAVGHVSGRYRMPLAAFAPLTGKACPTYEQLDESKPGVERAATAPGSPSALAACSGGTGWGGAAPESTPAYAPSESIGNAGGDIDDMLGARETAGESVLTDQHDGNDEWNIPDLSLIFRPPKFLMEAMAMGVEPGKWVKLAPNAAAGTQRSKWKMLKTVMSAGIGFKAGAAEAEGYSEEEREARKKQLQLEVQQLQNFLLSITKAWDDLATEMGDDGVGADGGPDSGAARQLDMPPAGAASLSADSSFAHGTGESKPSLVDSGEAGASVLTHVSGAGGGGASLDGFGGGRRRQAAMPAEAITVNIPSHVSVHTNMEGLVPQVWPQSAFSFVPRSLTGDLCDAYWWASIPP